MAKKQNDDLYEVLHPSHKKQQEHSYEYNPIMYDKLPYERDSDLCNPKYLSTHPSHLIRFYTLDKDSYKIKVPK